MCYNAQVVNMDFENFQSIDPSQIQQLVALKSHPDYVLFLSYIIKTFIRRNRIDLLKTIFSKVFPKAHIIKTDSTHAEMVKYLTNTFLATKVSFANEMYSLCNQLNVDYDKVVEYATLDDRLGKSHWNVPGPDGDFGFGGHCFPKDTFALVTTAKKNGYNLSILQEAINYNNSIRKDDT